MVEECQIREIVETYDLRERIKNKISGIAIRRIKELHLDNFEEIYEYISNLIDKFRERYNPVSSYMAINLNRPISNNTELIDLFLDSSEDKTKPADREIRYLEETANNFYEELSDKEKNILDTLTNKIRRNNLNIGLDFNKLLEDRNYILERLRQLSRFSNEDGKIILPPRTIERIEFSPLRINYKKRFYNGKPIEFFLKNKEHYKGLGRYGLKKFDRPLYRSLLEHKQVEQAIPQAARLTFQQKIEVIDSHNIYNGNAEKASEVLNVCSDTIRKYWKEAGLKSEGQKIRLSSEEISQIVGYYKTYDANATLASQNSDHDTKTILRYWKRAGFKIIKSRGLGPSQIEKIVESYDKFCRNAKLASKELGYCAETIRTYWKEAGLKPGNQDLKSRLGEIREAYEKYNRNACIAARELKCDRKSLAQYWVQLGLLPGGNNLSESKRKEIINSFEEYNRNAYQAAKGINCSYSTLRKVWSEEGLNKKETVSRIDPDTRKTIIDSYHEFNGNATHASKYFKRSREIISRIWKRNGLRPIGNGCINISKQKNIE
ncbi:Uncharacterised protein [uncultured archaeon]|nr:Uncharacterised protein [uncultured archaeon]